ncbi:hypothetical protein BH10ACT6_BH10ACT6_04110 [soil metagenome]
MPRSLALVRASAAAALVAAALVGCTQTPTATPTSSCAGSTQKVLLTDDSASTVTAYDAADVPKIFAIPATPAPSCYYKTTTEPAPINGVSYIVTHRTLLYIDLSEADAAALVAGLRTTVSVPPWTVSYDNAPAAPAAGATPTPGTIATSSSAQWEYNFNGAPTDDKGEMGYLESIPITLGTATHAGLSKAVNVVRIETELRSPKK